MYMTALNLVFDGALDKKLVVLLYYLIIGFWIWASC